MDRRSLYDDDIYAWAQQQAATLRRLAETRPDLPNELDLENVAEEIESVGRSELHETERLLTQLFVHLIKAYADPASRARGHWMSEALTFQFDARRAFSPSMRRRMDLEDLWVSAGRIADAKLYAFGVKGIPPLPTPCPFTLDELLGADFDVNAAVERLTPGGQ